MRVFRVGIVQVAVIQDGNFPRWGLSWVGIFLGRNFPGGSHPGGSLPSTSLSLHANVSCEIRLLRILKNVVTNEIDTRTRKGSCPMKSVNCSSIKFSISIFVVPNFSQIRRKVCNFEVKFSIYYLMMTVWVCGE